MTPNPISPIRSGSLLLAAALLVAPLAAPLAASATEPVAVLGSVSGTVSVTPGSGRPRIVAQDSNLQAGDTVTTEKDSYAKLRFSDGGEIALRPNSSLIVHDYHYQAGQPQSDSLVMSLLKGGLRNITGLIGKRGAQAAYRLNGATATIGIRGTDFTARVCDPDCGQEANPGTGRKVPAPVVQAAARVAGVDGRMLATAVSGGQRVLTVGAPVYAGETVETDTTGFGTLVFADQSRIVLARGSRLTVSAFRYAPNQPESGNLAVDLVKGGVRVVTGLIAKLRPQQVKFSTVTATIGIRGTNFDLGCGAAQAPAAEIDPLARVGENCDGALFVRMREGAVELRSGEETLLVEAGQTGYVAAPGTKPRRLNDAELPRDWPLPLPEAGGADFATLAGPDGSRVTDAGLYVLVAEGRVALVQGGREIEINPGETGFAPAAPGADLQKFGAPPTFLRTDPWLRSIVIDPAMCRAM